MNINEEGDTLVDIIKNNDLDKPDSFNTKDMLKTKLISLLDVLDNREKSIVGDYFGLTNTKNTRGYWFDFNLTKRELDK